MGRFVTCMEACSHMHDFKDSVSTVVRHSLWRGYTSTLLDSVWGRFLFQKWQATDFRLPELRAWFRKLIPYLQRTFPQTPRTAPMPPIRQGTQNPDFLKLFGRPPPPSSNATLNVSHTATNARTDSILQSLPACARTTEALKTTLPSPHEPSSETTTPTRAQNSAATFHTCGRRATDSPRTARGYLWGKRLG